MFCLFPTVNLVESTSSLSLVSQHEDGLLHLYVFIGNFYTGGLICLCPNSLLILNAMGTFAKSKSFQCIDKAASVIVLAEPNNEAEILHKLGFM